MVEGSCLCGAVAYAVSAPFIDMHHCHCSRCRKQHGAAFATFARAPRSSFRLTRGAEHVREYRSSAEVPRTFCDTCGSSLQFLFDDLPDVMWIAAGTFDGVPDKRPEAHIFVGSRAPWHDITDDLPCHEGYPPRH